MNIYIPLEFPPWVFYYAITCYRSQINGEARLLSDVIEQSLDLIIYYLRPEQFLAIFHAKDDIFSPFCPQKF